MARYMVNPELNILLNNRKDISGMVSTIPDFCVNKKHECDKYDKIVKTEQCIKICNYKYFHVRKPYG